MEELIEDWISILLTWLKMLTGFGDPAVLMPLAALILIWLLLMRALRDAVWWGISVALCVGLTASLKMAFYACAPIPDLHSPSGHVSLSTLVYGAMTLVAATGSSRLPRITAISAGAGFILAVAVSRLLLSFHSAIEIGLGLVIGTSALALFGWSYSPDRARMGLPPLFVIGGILLLGLHGRELYAEQLVRDIASYLQIQCG
jgi:membrane-associated phospholipid phosphatase